MLPPTLHAETGTVSLPASGNYIGLNIVDCVVTGFHGRPIGQAIIFCTCGFFFLLFFSPILSGRRLDVYRTSTHGVALVRI